MEFLIHEDNMPKLIKKLNRIENKCNKYGCTFRYAEIGEEFQPVQNEVVNTGLPVMERFVRIDVEGTAIINNWEFIATIEHKENGNIIRTYSNKKIPEKYRVCKPHCDHCGIDRYRKDTYIILNIQTGEYKQVGKSCLADYTHGLSAEIAVDFASYFDTISHLDRAESMGEFTRRYFGTKAILLSANDIIKKCGFVSRSKAEDEGNESTASKLREIISESKAGQKEAKKINFQPDTEENKAEIKNALEWLVKQESDNQYIQNLQTTCKNKYCEWRDIGIIASLPAAYFKAMETEKERKAREEANANKKPSEYIGTEGEKIELHGITINQIACYETQYGITYIFKILDASGNIFIWRTNKSKVENKKTGEYTPIENYNALKGTIKAHAEYHDEKQTELTRCKVL